MGKIIAGAQGFGFGPAAKLTTIARHLKPLELTFVGQGIAFQYALTNRRHFADTRLFDLDNSEALQDLVSKSDLVISVMEPKLVFAAVRCNIPVFFFDSLLGFWDVGRGFPELQRFATMIKEGSANTAARAIEDLTVHEAMLVSHMVATKSLGQMFAGVPERIAQMNALNMRNVHATGPMIDTVLLARSQQSAGTARSRLLVVNLAGVVNPFCDRVQDRDYVDLILDWLYRYAAKSDRFDEIDVCSGAFPNSQKKTVNGVKICTGLLSHEELMTLVAHSSAYLTPPGLTSLQEAIALSKIPMILPDQHYGHFFNRKYIEVTNTVSACFSDLGFYDYLPEDDMAGTLAIKAVAKRIRDDPNLFQSFADYMDGALERYLAVPADAQDATLRQLRSKFNGYPFSDALKMILHDVSVHQTETRSIRHAATR